MSDQVFVTVGRRKEAVARVRMKAGTGKLVVNGKDPLDYFRRDTLVMDAERTLVSTERKGQNDDGRLPASKTVHLILRRRSSNRWQNSKFLFMFSDRTRRFSIADGRV